MEFLHQLVRGRSGTGCSFRLLVCHDSPLLLFTWLIVEIFNRNSYSIPVVNLHDCGQVPVIPMHIVPLSDSQN